MRRALTLVVLRALLVLILAASAALLYDYTRPMPAFCEAGAGCDAVRASSFAYILGIPQPALGLLAYLVVFGVTLMDHPRRRKLLFVLVAIGGAFAASFLVIQAFVIQRFCTLCVVVDVAAVLAVPVAWWHRGAAGHDGGMPRFGWSLIAAVAVVAPLLFAGMRPDPPAPAAVARFWSPGRVTIVELSDFQCPFCRVLHPALKQAVEPYGDDVRVVRLSVPLASHPKAKPAARAFACAKHMGHGDRMAHELFTTEDLSPNGIRAAAARIGLRDAAFESCFTGSQGHDLMMRDVEIAKQIEFRGLPTLWIGSEELLGARDAEDIGHHIDEQRRGGTSNLPAVSAGWMWGLLVLLLGIAIGVGVGRRPPSLDPS